MSYDAFLIENGIVVKTVNVNDLTIADKHGKSYACCGLCGTCMAPMELHYGLKIQRFNVKNKYEHRPGCEKPAEAGRNPRREMVVDLDGAGFEIAEFIQRLHDHRGNLREPGPGGNGGGDTGGARGGGGAVIGQEFILPRTVSELFDVLSRIDVDELYGDINISEFLIDRRTVGLHKEHPTEGMKLFGAKLGPNMRRISVNSKKQYYLIDPYSSPEDAIVFVLNFPDHETRWSVGKVLFDGEGENKDRLFIVIGEVTPIQGHRNAFNVEVHSAADIERKI